MSFGKFFKSKSGFISTTSLAVLSTLLFSLGVQAMDEQNEEITSAQKLKPYADKGNKDCQFFLGLLYEFGKGVAQDGHQAVHYYKLAADQGDARAQYHLGCFYGDGKLGVRQDELQSFRYFEMAANQGHAGAQKYLAYRYIVAIDVKQDWHKAMNLLCSAAILGDQESVSDLTDFAEKGNETAQYLLGDMYDTGRGVVQNHDQARRYYTMAADQGHADAQFMLGDMYETGRGVGQNSRVASEYYLAAGKGSKDALERRGKLFPGG